MLRFTFDPRFGTAFKRVKSILVVEAIAEVLGLNDITSLGIGFHPRCPSINISRVDLVEWAGLTYNQYSTGYRVVREVRQAVAAMETAVFPLSTRAKRDLAIFRFLLTHGQLELPSEFSKEETEAIMLTTARLQNLASFHND